MMRLTAFALGVVALVGSLTSTAALAGGGFHKACWVADAGFGYPCGPSYLDRGFGYNGYIGEPYLYGAYHGDGSCYLVRHRVSTRHGWRFHLVQVCG
jgi:hypothetical protein